MMDWEVEVDREGRRRRRKRNTTAFLVKSMLRKVDWLIDLVTEEFSS